MDLIWKNTFLCCSDKPQKLLLRSALAKLFNHNPLFSLSLEQNSPQSEKKNNSKQIFCIRQSENRIREMFNADNSFHLMLQFHVVVHKLFNTFCKTKTGPEGEFLMVSHSVCFYAETMEERDALCLFLNCFSGWTTQFWFCRFIRFNVVRQKNENFSTCHCWGREMGIWFLLTCFEHFPPSLPSHCFS